jgi:Ca2+-binding RTX toxin-like protein
MPDYALEGPKWGNAVIGTAGGTVTWAMDATVPAWFQSDLAAAFADWSAYANIQFTEVSSVASSMIDINLGSIDGHDKTLGITSYAFSRGGSLTSATVEFDSGEGWQPSAASNHVTSYDGVRLFLVALHEIGHAIGLDHYNAAPAVMNAVLTPSIDDLKTPDIDGVRAIYGAAPATGGLIVAGSGPDTIVGGDNFDIASWQNEASGLTLNLADQTLNAGSAAGDHVSNVEGFYLTNFADSFTGGSASVFVYGFAGADTITGSAASDIIDGGPGSDTIDGGGGFDYVSYYSSTTGVTVDLKNPANNTGDAKGDVVSNAEAYILTSKDDVFVGTDSGQNIVFGYEGNDTLTGGFNANNWFFGGDGNDRMTGGGVQDLFVLGNGADTVVAATPTPIAGSSVFGFTPGTDAIEISRSAFGLAAGYAISAGTTFTAGAAPAATTAQPTFFYYADSGLLYFDHDGLGSTAATLLMQFHGHPVLAAADFHLV